MRIAGIARCLIASILLFFVVSPASAQLSATDSLLYHHAIANAVARYHQTLGDQSGLYNGSQYPGYPFNFKDGGHAFFATDKALPGTIVYDHLYYPVAKLLYDEIAEQVVLSDSTHRLQLYTPLIDRFTIGDNVFIHLLKDSASPELVSSGFYQVLYQGKVMVLKKEVKTIREELRGVDEGIVRFVEGKLHYYIFKNKRYFPLTSKNSLGAILGNKKALQQFIKENKLNFKERRDELLVKSVAWYEQHNP